MKYNIHIEGEKVLTVESDEDINEFTPETCKILAPWIAEALKKFEDEGRPCGSLVLKKQRVSLLERLKKWFREH